MLRLTLIYYSNFIDFMENPQTDECPIEAEELNPHRWNHRYLIRGVLSEILLSGKI